MLAMRVDLTTLHTARPSDHTCVSVSPCSRAAAAKLAWVGVTVRRTERVREREGGDEGEANNEGWIGLTVRNMQYEVLIAIVPGAQFLTQPWQPRIARSVFVRQQHARHHSRTSQALWLPHPRPHDFGLGIDKRT